MSSLCHFKDFVIWLIIDFHYISKLLNLVFSWKQRKSCIQLSNNCTKAPDVNGSSIWNSKNDLWCSIETRLDICIYSLAKETTTSIVDYFYTGLVLLLQKDVFWFEITVN